MPSSSLPGLWEFGNECPSYPCALSSLCTRQYPANTAVVCGDHRFSYSQFASRVSRLAGALRECVNPGERVAFLSPNCHRLLEAYYGVVEAGAVLLPLNIRLASDELAYILNDAGPTALFLDRTFAPLVESIRAQVPTLRRFFLLDGAPCADWLAPQSYEDLLETAKPYRADLMKIDENAIAEIFYTSGTEAAPKGVMLTHRNVYLHALETALALGVTARDAHLHTIPLFHANGWGAAHFLTLMGGKHVMTRAFDPAEVFRLIARERVNTCFLVPAMALALLHSGERHEYELSSLKWIAIGGSASSPTLVREVSEKLQCECFSGYGLTEAAPVVAISRHRPGVQWQGEVTLRGRR